MSVRLARKIVWLILLSSPAWAGNPQPAPTLRWAEEAQGCTVRFADDGHTSYGVSTADFALTLTIDNRELEKLRYRSMPMIGVLLSVNSKGSDSMGVIPSQSTLEFTKHFQVVMRALDPATMLKQLQQSMDDLTDEIEHHQVRKHPELKDAKENELQQRLKDYTEMMDFISTRALRGSTLGPSNASTTGWVFFSTKNRWIGRWRRPEQFVFRIPIEKIVVEFPFELPPKGGKAQLR